MKTIRLKRYFAAGLMALCAMFTTPVFAQFLKIYGTASENYFNKIIPDGSEFYVLGLDDGNGTITRVNASGVHLWTRKLIVPSGLTDAAIIPGSGGKLMFVGFTLPFANTNGSILGIVTPNGTFQKLTTYDVPGQEGFTAIEYNSTSSTFSVLGFQNLTGPTDDVVLLDFASNGTLISKKLFPSTANDGFEQDLKILPNGDMLVAGFQGNIGVIFQYSSTGNFIGGVQEPSPFLFQAVTPTLNGHVLAVGRPFSGGLPRLSRFDGSLFPVWERTVQGMNTLDQVLEAPNGDIYAVGTGNFGGLDRAIVLKIREISGTPVLLWARYFQYGESSYTGGKMALLPNGDIAFADGREGNLNGFGLNDAFLAVTNGDMNTACTANAQVTLDSFVSVYNGPVANDLTSYDLPPGTDVDFSWSDWKARWACGPYTPKLTCSDILVRVEPDQVGRTVSFEGIGVVGDDVTLDFSPNTATIFPVGITTVVATATDASGGTSNCSFTVTVERMPYDSMQPPPFASPDGIFDRVRDRFGNPYRLGELQIPETMGGNLLCTSSGYFDLYFEPGCGMEGTTQDQIDRRNVLCQVFSDLSAFIVPANPATKVNIWVRDIGTLVSNPSTSAYLGLASSFTVVPSGAPAVGGLLDGEVWKTINSGVDSYTGVASPLSVQGGQGGGFFHGFVTFNFVNTSVNWHTDLSVPTVPALLDLYTVALHEATHALGFNSLIDYPGKSRLGAMFPNYYSRYDSYLKTINNLPLITNTSACSMYDYQYNPQLVNVVPNVLASGGTAVPNQTNCSTAIRFTGSVGQKVYTPNVFEVGSSLSHLEDQCRVPVVMPNDNYYVMSNAQSSGQSYMKRYLKKEERMVLCDLGYKVDDVYGNTGQMSFSSYAGGDCPGLDVAGVNDGIGPGGVYTYMTTPSGTTSAISPQLNDYQAVSFNCLEVIIGGGTVSQTSGNSFTYSAPSTPGVKLLRYIPVGASGNKGNITYILILVKSPGCPADVCNLISNGGFETHTSCSTLAPSGAATIDCWQPLNTSPDLFTRSCNLGGTTIGVNTFNSIPPSGTYDNSLSNTAFLGLGSWWIGQQYIHAEAMQTQLSAPLIPGNTYKISFYAKTNNNITGPGSNIPAIIQFSSAPTYPLSNSTFYPGSFAPLFTPDIVVPNNNQWNYLDYTFTYNGTSQHTNLIFAYYNPNLPTSITAYLFIDDLRLMEVGSTVTFVPPSPVCDNAPAVNLNSTVSLPGGVFTGTGVQNNNGTYTFNPSIAGLGSHILTYTVTDINGCINTTTATIQVVVGPGVTFNPLPSPICLNAPFLGLDSYVSIPGGSFTGPGVVCSGGICEFYPAIAGTGIHSITYTYNSGPCPLVFTQNIQVESCIDTCDISNHCLDFDGFNDFVNVPNPLNSSSLQNSFTVACWFRDALAPAAPDGILHRLFGLAWNGPRFEVGDQDGLLTFYNTTILQSVNIRDGLWHHLAAVKNGSFVTIYLDCVPVTGLTSINVGTFTGAAQNIHIGDWAGGGPIPRFWNGQVDEFKVWGGVLNTAQICDERFCSLDPNNINLLIHMPFDQYTAYGNNVGNTLADNVVAGGLDGTLTNFVLNGVTSNWVARGRDHLPNCNVDHFAWLEGNTRRNLSGRSKVYDGDIFTAGFEYTPATPPNFTPVRNPVFTRRRPDGTIVWRRMLDLQASGSINDFVRTDEGCFLLVGHTPDFKGDNQSFIAQIDNNGNLNWINQYDFRERETLTRIIRSDNPSNPGFPYIICGIQKNAGTSNDDVLLMAIDGRGTFDWVREIGNKLPLPTDDSFCFDLINYNGGYALAGTYDRNGIQHPVLFFTDAQGLQDSRSSEYQTGVVFYDTKTAANGQDILVAGSLTGGGAVLAKMDQNGVQIWAKQFPQLTVLRKMVVRPNGDIFAVGQRTTPGKYRNVIVKLRDLGASVSVFWQKNAELTPTTPFWPDNEINWSAADLVWYSGGMYFFTDSRINNSNGWGNEDIGAAMYNLDQSPDICPFTKENVVSQNFSLTQADMPLLTNVLAPFPIPSINPISTSLTLLRDSLCDYHCTCSFTNMTFRKNYPSPVWIVPVTGYNVGVFNLPGCPSASSPIRFTGVLKCKGGCVFSALNWTLTNPNQVVTTGASNTAAFNIGLPLQALQTPGTYKIVLIGKCGADSCICEVKFNVPQCSAACSCAEPAFTNSVNSGFNWLQLPGCNFKFTPKSLTACDLVTWQVAAAGSSNFTTIGTTSGNQTINYQFLNSNQYVVCMTVKRQPSPFTACQVSRCWTINVDCSLAPAPAGESEENLLLGGACEQSVLENGGFTIGAEAGGLNEAGSAWNWDVSGGTPEVVLEPGKLDDNLVRMRGNGGFADILFQDSIGVTTWDSVQFSIGLRPIQGLVLPGTELVVRLSAQRQDSVWCSDSTCMEIMRLPIPMLDSSVWLTAGTFATVREVALPYLTLHVENPFSEDDLSLSSVVDIDNICLSRYGLVSIKQPWEYPYSLHLFPNPNTGGFRVKLPEPALPGMEFRIISLTGQAQIVQSITPGTLMQTIHAETLPTGLYFLQFCSEGKMLAVEKFVKQ